MRVASAVGVDAIGQNDDVGLRRRIDPEHRAGIPGVSVTAYRRQLLAVGGQRGTEVPAQAPQVRGARWRSRGGHFVDRLRPENPGVAGASSVKHHLGKHGQVMCGRKKSRMARYAAHPAGSRVVRLADQQPAVDELGGSDPPVNRRCRAETGVIHFQGREDFALAPTVERPSRNPAHQLAQNLEIDIAIDAAGSGRANRALGDDLRHRPVVAGPLRVQVKICAQPRIMGEQLAHRD